MPRNDKTVTGDPEYSCAACGTTWTPVRGQWLVKDAKGRLHYERLEKATDGHPVPLARCPTCFVLQYEPGRVRVEEVVD